MLTAYPAPRSDPSPQGLRKAKWIDLIEPSDEERTNVARAFGFELPSRADLSEVESSSRISEENGVLYLSLPHVSRALDETPSPIGFVLSRDVLVTIRYMQLRTFDSVAAKCAKSEATRSGVEVFTALVDEMVDLEADLLEGIATELDTLSRSVFIDSHASGRNQRRSNKKLYDTLIRIGATGERLSRIRGTLVGLRRIVPFAGEPERDWMPIAIRGRLKSAQTDLVSLTDYQTHLSDKIQFLLDAVLGLITTKQNDIFTVLTVVSVVGIPPTLVAGIYGMNFKFMPELEWTWGYAWGLGLIALSAVLPLAWYKWRGWL